VVPIRDGQVPDDERRLAIRYMGAGGWAWGAVALVEVLENADDPMRAEAQRALENIAGEVRGESPEPWREWLASLQGEVVGRR
jgi:aminoglycoside phosphotransferase (APT) family kinase protein